MYSPLIYGKNGAERIVSIEPNDSELEIFQLLPNGEVTSTIEKNRYWILSPKPLEEFGWSRLDGELHYKYGKQFLTRDAYIDYRNKHRRYDLYSVYDPKESALIKDGYTYFKGLKHTGLPVLAFDIEATTLNHTSDAKLLIIANTYRDVVGNITRKLFTFKDYSNEGEMIEAWCNWVVGIDPCVILGHNIFTYDLPYLSFIARRHGKTLNLGRYHKPIEYAPYDSEFRKDGSQFYTYKKARVYGRELIDTFFLAIKADIGRKYESYALKSIIRQEGLEIENRQFYDASQIRFKYEIPEEWEKIKKYSEHDGDDALAVYDKHIPAFFYLTQYVPKSFQSIIESASGSQLNALLVRSYLQNKHSIPRGDNAERFEGARSFGIPGVYKSAIRFDFSAMYPSIMLQYEVYPKDKDPNKHFLQMLEYFTADRMRNKKLAKETGDGYYKMMEQTAKVFINSAYGMMGAPGLNFNYIPGASKVTEIGRELLGKCITWATGNPVDYYKQYFEDEAEVEDAA